MIFSLFKDHGVLGINSRNLEYLRPFNRRKAIQMADSKLATKQFLSTRGISVPRLIATIRSRGELAKFDFNTLLENWVLKPDAGFGGEGIIVIEKKLGGGVWRKASDGSITREELEDHILDILDGKFSIASLPDTAFFETRLVSADLIPGLAVVGLPDVRIIVHNLIPVMAMLRIPTPESGGKANVHLGGIGIGIDLGSGKTTHATQYNKIISKLPGDISSSGHQIPRWGDILLMASRSQLHTNLGYLAADIVLDEKSEPILIEVNARAGLMVQVANLAPLKKRLERVRGLSVDSPEKGVALGRELFSKTFTKKTVVEKTVVNYITPGEILIEKGSHRVTAELDPTHATTTIDTVLAEKLKLPKVGRSHRQVHLKLLIGGKRITTVAELTDLSEADYKIVLGRRDLTGFVIDPTSQETKSLPAVAPKNETPKFDYRELDQKLMDLDRQIKLLSHLKPTNLMSERKKFFSQKKYNPVFHYPSLKFNPSELLAILAKLEYPDTPLGRIFRDKRAEIERKVALLVALGTSAFTEKSRDLYGFPSDATLVAARELMAARPKKFSPDAGALTAAAAGLEFEKAFARTGLKKWRVVFRDDLAADALAGKRNTLFIRSDATFSRERLRATIAHEVDTHIFRAENGRGQPYEIFARGLANYLETEEGLAIFNQNLVLTRPHEKKYWSVVGTLAVEFAAEHGFRAVFEFVRKLGFSDERAWLTTLKVKRGLSDTSASGGFTKEHLYFTGWQKIEKFVAGGGDLKKLYVGKIRVEDIPMLSALPALRPARLLPDFYKKGKA